MSDDLLAYYNRELTYVRRLAARFADAHPGIAERLRLSTQEASDDPHVERMIEGFAYLTARIRLKIDDEFPEITGSLLDVLYPHYQAPIPSMAVVRFQLDPEQVQITTGSTIPQGTELETEPVKEVGVRYRTCYPVTLWPVELTRAVLAEAPLPAPSTAYSPQAKSVLRLVLGCTGQGATFSSLGVESLRFFLRGQPQHVYRLYEQIFNHAIGVAIAGSARDARPVVRGRDVLGQVGFGRDEGMLPYPARSFVGYRLLTEYFAFPQKYLFFDLALPRPAELEHLGGQLEAYVYFDRSVPDLMREVSAETFQLGCTPVVNLYSHPAHAIELKHNDFEYQVVPDRRRPMAHEVYSVDGVVASSPEGEAVEYMPFFSIRHARNRGNDRAFWHASRRPAEASSAGQDRGTDVFVSLVDQGFRPSMPAGWTLLVDATCLSRDLPKDLPFGPAGDRPRLQFREGGTLVGRISCLTAPTTTLRPASQLRSEARRGLLWRLISHLSLNHLSLVGDGPGGDGRGDLPGDALREILKLYDFADNPETRNQIDGILHVSSRRVVGRVGGESPAAFTQGLEVTIQFDEDRFPVNNLFLFASVLERFLALYCTINSFTKLIVTVKGRQGEMRRWPPRTGERVLA